MEEVDDNVDMDDGNNEVGGFCILVVGINTPWHEFKLESICIYAFVC